MASAASQEDAAEGLQVILEHSVLKQALDSLLELGDEAILHLGREGLHVELVDPANVAMIVLDIQPEAFESVGDGQIVFGTNLNRLEDYLKHADSTDLVQLGYKEASRYLNIQYASVDVDMALIDPDNMRGEPDMPDIPQTAMFETTGSELDTAVSLVDLASDHLRLEAHPGEREVRVIGEGDTDTVTTTWTRDEVSEAQIDEETVGLYSLDYVKNHVNPIPKDARVEVRLATEHPLRMSYGFADGDGSVETMLAPRIENS